MMLGLIGTIVGVIALMYWGVNNDTKKIIWWKAIPLFLITTFFMMIFFVNIDNDNNDNINKDKPKVVDNSIKLYTYKIKMKVIANEKNYNGDTWDTFGDPDIIGNLSITDFVTHKTKTIDLTESDFNVDNQFNSKNSFHLDYLDKICINIFDKDELSNEFIGGNCFVFKNNLKRALPLYYKKYVQGKVEFNFIKNHRLVKLSPNEIFYTQAQEDFEDGTNYNEIIKHIYKNYFVYKQQIEQKRNEIYQHIRKLQQEIANSQNKIRQDKLQREIKKLQKQLSKLKIDINSNSYTAVPYFIKDWQVKIFDVNSDYIKGISNNEYVVFFNKYKYLIPFVQKDMIFKFNGNIVKDYSFGMNDNHHVWKVNLTKLDSNNTLLQKYYKYTLELKSYKKTLYNIFIKNKKVLPAIHTKLAQPQFENILKIINNKPFKEYYKTLNTAKQQLLAYINPEFKNKYIVKIDKDLKVNNVNISLKHYVQKLLKYSPKNWNVIVDQVKQEKVKVKKSNLEITGDTIWHLTLAVFATKYIDVATANDVLNDQTTTKTIDVVYIYAHNNNQYYKIAVSQNNKILENIDKGTHLVVDGKFETIRNNIIYIFSKQIKVN